MLYHFLFVRFRPSFPSFDLDSCHSNRFQTGLDLGGLGSGLHLEGLGVGVVPGLGLVEVPQEVVDGQHVELLGDEVEDEPVAELLHVAKGVGLQDGLHVGSLSRLATLKNRNIINEN